MQPVQFQCGHCGKIMAVGSDHLGQQVRCPHCQQVVVAPPPAAPPPAPAPGPAVEPFTGLPETILHTPTPPSDAEDIFSQTEVSDDLFGRSEAPRVEMPPEPLAPTLPGDNPAPAPQLEPTISSTLPWQPLPESATTSPFVPAGERDNTDILPASGPAPWPGVAATETLATSDLPPPGMPPPPDSEPVLGGEPAAGPTRPRTRTEPKVPWFMLVVFCPLLLYAIVISIFSYLLYRQEQGLEQQLRRRFEMMPDEGDKPGTQKAKQVRLWRYDATLPTRPLPDYLCTTLKTHQPLRIGDLEVTPDRVERKRIRVVVAETKPEPCQGDSLVLYLKMKNRSTDYAFAPLDNYFDRRWTGGAQPPFTLLEAGDKYRFHGGPAKWFPLADQTNLREWIEGRGNLPTVLQPGEQKEFFVCTNGDDPQAVSVLFGDDKPAYHGSFLWRIRVRRGLVRFRDKDYSTTAVIGVRFSDEDIQNAPAAVQ